VDEHLSNAAPNSKTRKMSEAVVAHLASQRDAILERLKALLRMPSVSTDPQCGAGMRDAREFLLGRLRELASRMCR
jgi:acetylornithine deacetylase/succinyl-diaminopimelate desuccinylase-like protein